MITLFRTELSKQFRRPRTYVALGAVAVIPIIITVTLWLSPPRTPNRGSQSFFYFATQSGFFVPVAALTVMSRLLLVFAVAVFAGDAISSDAAWGNLRNLLVRPISRARLLSAKLAMVALFTLIATVLITSTGLLAGSIAFGWKGLPALASFFGLNQSPGELTWNLVIATAYVTWSLAALVTFGLMVSTMTDTPAGAIGAGVGLYVFSQIVDAIEPLGSLRQWLPTHYLDAWTSLFSNRSADMVKGVWLQIPYLLVFCGIAWWWFLRKDVVS